MKTVIGNCPLGSECEDIKELNGENVIVRCPWFQGLKGKNPQTGADIEENGCAISWLPLLLTENSKVQIETGAAIESFRNEFVKTEVSKGEMFLSFLQGIKLLGGKSQ